MTRSAVLRRIGAVVGVWIALSGVASAELGGDQSTVTADRARMQGALIRIAQSDTYAIHEMQSAAGVLVREYVSSGTVFAVAWNGPWMPDLQQLLGPYFTRYQDAAARLRRNRRGRGPLSIQEPDLIVETSGHPRAFGGRAWLPARVPRGVQADAIR